MKRWLATPAIMLACFAVSAAAQSPDVLSPDPAGATLSSARIGIDGSILQQSGRWLESALRVNDDEYQLTVTGGVFLDAPTCTATALEAPAIVWFPTPPDTETIRVRVTDLVRGRHVPFQLICAGRGVYQSDPSH